MGDDPNDAVRVAALAYLERDLAYCLDKNRDPTRKPQMPDNPKVREHILRLSFTAIASLMEFQATGEATMHPAPEFVEKARGYLQFMLVLKTAGIDNLGEGT